MAKSPNKRGTGSARTAPKAHAATPGFALASALPLFKVAQQLRRWTDNVLGVAGSASELSLNLAKARASEPGQQKSIEKAASMLRQAREAAGMTTKDIDLFELNEAFASVVLRFMKVLKLDHSKVNVKGGAIAMGHPLGVTGAMILGTVLDELERRNLNTALVTLCVGAGMGTATIIERV